MTVAGFVGSGACLVPVYMYAQRGAPEHRVWVTTVLFSAAYLFYGLTGGGFKVRRRGIRKRGDFVTYRF